MGKLTEKLYNDICSDYSNGFSQSELLKKYIDAGITLYTIAQVTKSVSKERLSTAKRIEIYKSKLKEENPDIFKHDADTKRSESVVSQPNEIKPSEIEISPVKNLSKITKNKKKLKDNIPIV